MRSTDPRARNISRALEDRVRNAWLRLLARFIHGKKVRRSRRLGMTAALDTDRFVDFLFYVQGVYEKETLDLIDEFARRHVGRAQFLDVGANIGLMATYAAVRYPALNVVAFEPMPDLAHDIAKQQELNGVVFPVRQEALSDGDGELELYLPNTVNLGWDFGKYNAGMNTAHPTELHSSRRLTVSCTSLDLLVDRDSVVDPVLPTFIKIDVEGHEPEVLKGMTRFLSRSQDSILVVETLGASHPNRAGGVWAFMRDLGFLGSFVGRKRLFPCAAPDFDGLYLFERPALPGAAAGPG